MGPNPKAIRKLSWKEARWDLFYTNDVKSVVAGNVLVLQGQSIKGGMKLTKGRSSKDMKTAGSSRVGAREHESSDLAALVIVYKEESFLANIEPLQIMKNNILQLAGLLLTRNRLRNQD